MYNAPEIPPAAYAIAAYEAARLFSEDPADIFDADVKSRARFIAIEVMRRAYPYEHQSVMARNLGVEGTARHIINLCDAAKVSVWWKDQYVRIVETTLSRSIRRPITIAEVAKATRKVKSVEESQFVPGSVFVPRKRASVLIAPSRRPRDVTAYLMGDPGHASARMDRGEMSAGVE